MGPEYLARVGQLDPMLLSPIRHRGHDTQADLAILRSPDALTRARTGVINHVRRSAKAVGVRVPSCGTANFHRKAEGESSDALQSVLLPLVDVTGKTTSRIREFDRLIEVISEACYPETALLCQVSDVGPLTTLWYILTLESPNRFPMSRAGRSQSRPGGPQT